LGGLLLASLLLAFVVQRWRAYAQVEALMSRTAALKQHQAKLLAPSHIVEESVPAQQDVPSTRDETPSHDPIEDNPLHASEMQRKKTESMSAEDVPRYFEGKYQTESVDPIWAVQVAKDIRSAIDAALPTGSSVVSFGCRSTLCRLEVDCAGMREHNQLVIKLYKDPDSIMNTLTNGAQANMGEPDPKGRIKSVLYIGKKGKALLPE